MMEPVLFQGLLVLRICCQNWFSVALYVPERIYYITRMYSMVTQRDWTKGGGMFVTILEWKKSMFKKNFDVDDSNKRW